VSSGQIVTGEAVALDLQPAAFASRAVSGALDVATQLVLLFVVIYLDSKVFSSLDDAAGSAVALVSVLAVVLGYPLVMETLTRGRTLGKLAMGLRTVRDDGGPIRFRQALVRALLEIVEVWLLIGSPALVASLISSRGKRLGDLLAGTYVVRERGVTQRVPPPAMPFELAGWAQIADIGRIPDQLAVGVRQFLGRTASMQLDDGARGVGVRRSSAPGGDPPRGVSRCGAGRAPPPRRDPAGPGRRAGGSPHGSAGLRRAPGLGTRLTSHGGLSSGSGRACRDRPRRRRCSRPDPWTAR
jgi:uncharacterized RDD family membrane protein YckC